MRRPGGREKVIVVIPAQVARYPSTRHGTARGLAARPRQA